MLGRFFRGGKVRPGFFFSAGENLYWYTFSGGDSIPRRFFRGEVLCGGKLYATTPEVGFKTATSRYQFRNGWHGVGGMGLASEFSSVEKISRWHEIEKSRSG